MAVEFNGGVVIGADSRTTTGSYIANRVTDKLTMIHDRIYCCRSGSAADTQAVADIVQYHAQMYRYVGVLKSDLQFKTYTRLAFRMNIFWQPSLFNCALES
jgi:20S proteasome alpha/beta subunit